MIDALQLKLRRMRAALEHQRAVDLSTATVEWNELGDFRFDPSGGMTDAELSNAAHSIIYSTAYCKDALKDWCRAIGVPFHGESLINSNKSVSIVHDLWNLDKHHVLDKPPRSGFTPRIGPIYVAMTITSDPQTGMAMVLVTPNADGMPSIEFEGSPKLNLRAAVLDEQGNNLGQLVQICTEAADAWEQAFKDAALPV